MTSTRKAVSKKTAKNSSHKSKRAVVDELRWADIDEDGIVSVWGWRATRRAIVALSAQRRTQRIFRVRITEVSK